MLASASKPPAPTNPVADHVAASLGELAI